MMSMNEASQLCPGEPLPLFVSNFCTPVVLSRDWQPGKRSLCELS